MKLIYYIILRITFALTFILTVWAIFFYVTMIDEVNDEVDDALEDYSETIIIRALAGEELPSKTNGSILYDGSKQRICGKPGGYSI